MVTDMAETQIANAGTDHTQTNELASQTASAAVASGEPEVANRPTAAQAVDATSAEQPAREARPLMRLFRWSVRSAPPILVFGLLAAIGYWGHQNDWKIPAFSEMTGNGKPAVEGWCAEHGVPEEICISCNADLMPKGQLYGWCREHGVAECVLEHPELAQLKETPTISQQDLQRVREALAVKDRPKNDPLCKMHLRRIQFASREVADIAGIDIGLVGRGRVVEAIPAVGEVRYDPTRVTRLASRAAGTVWRVEKNVGDPVREGDVLALVDAATVGQAKAELQQAVAQLNLHDQTVKRLEGLEDVVAGRRVLEAAAQREQAEAAVRKAVQTLVNLGLPIALDELRGMGGQEIAARLHFVGLPAAVAQQLDPQQTTANLLPVLATRDGVVVSRDVVAGEVIDTSRTLFTIVDNRHMWLLLDVPLEDAQYVKVGQRVQFRPDGSSHEHAGQIIWISTRVDADTRTIKVRAELSNDDGQLRDESFGAGQIVLRAEENAIVAPKEAIHWEGCCHVAFVRDKGFLAEGSYKVFHTRMVRPGVTTGDQIELIAGLLPGEVVATQGSGVLRAELLKGNLGAGCLCEH